MQQLSLPQSLHTLLTRIQDAGFLAYAVGGCVRDSLLGRPISDWDVTTNATPTEIKSIFADCRTIDTGIQHGTVTVLWEGDSYEVTVFRVDGEYADGRHPNQVAFTTSLEEDLARRDFTVNAMAYSPSEGIVDPFGGRADLEKGLLRAVGEPTRRFTEDALRILRGVRFASVLGFSIEEETAKAMLALAPRLSLVSLERILVELTKTFTGKDAFAVLSLYYEVVKYAWPCLESEALYFDGLSLFPYLPSDIDTRMAALFSPLGEKVTTALLLSLKCSREKATTVSRLVEKFHQSPPQDLYEEKCLLADYGLDFCLKITDLWNAKIKKEGKTPTKYPKNRDYWQALASRNLCLSLSSLAVNGSILKSLGISDGKAIGDTLHHLLEKVMREELPNDKTALITYLSSHFSL